MDKDVWYIAECKDGCTPMLPMPFYDEAERNIWADVHETTGHRVERREEPKRRKADQ